MPSPSLSSGKEDQGMRLPVVEIGVADVVLGIGRGVVEKVNATRSA
jgi:hypothetical protein